MRADDPNARRRVARSQGLDYDDAEDSSIEFGPVTSRGAKYWTTGAIPLIAPELLGGIISSASDIAVVIEADGTVLSVLTNPEHKLFDQLTHWEGRNIRDVLAPESIPKFDARLAKIDTTPAHRGVELNHIDGVNWDFPIRYSFHRIGPEGALLMLGRDLRPVAEMQQALVKAQIALEQEYEDQREHETRYRVLLGSTRDAIAFVQVSNGRVTDLNQIAAGMLGGAPGDIAGHAFAQEFEGRRRGEFLETLLNSALADGQRPIKLMTRRSQKAVSITPSLFRAAGERLLLCRIDPAEEVEQAHDALSENLSALYQEGVDAMVFTDADGVVQAANEAFLKLTDAAHVTAVKGKSLATFLSRGSVDMKVLLENAARAGQMRMYATKLTGEHGAQISVEMSATYLNDRAHPCFGFVIRDTSRVEAARGPVGVSEGAVGSVMELVGSTSLKEIVAQTTDVVEKMCIETAVELTRNNRVAAAEMLGLSRQSLYVKLRKYGLLARDTES